MNINYDSSHPSGLLLLALWNPKSLLVLMLPANYISTCMSEYRGVWIGNWIIGLFGYRAWLNVVVTHTHTHTHTQFQYKCLFRTAYCNPHYVQFLTLDVTIGLWVGKVEPLVKKNNYKYLLAFRVLLWWTVALLPSGCVRVCFFVSWLLR
jgi:hypothetical protein